MLRLTVKRRNTRTRPRLSAAKEYRIRCRAVRSAAPRSATARHNAPRNWAYGIGLGSCARSSSPACAPRNLRWGCQCSVNRHWELAGPATKLSFPPVANLATASVDSELDAPAACLTAHPAGILDCPPFRRRDRHRIGGTEKPRRGRAVVGGREIPQGASA
jgi:hypothetical protein